MADADEDAIPRSQTSSSNFTSDHNDPSYDPEDETQDFRFLASLSPVTGVLPKRGEKDFEPNPTRSQASALNDSREAMHNALAVERIHPPRNSSLVGQYLPNEKDWRQDVPTRIYGPGGRCVVVEKFKGGHNKTLGREDWRNWTWLLPEEALFLLERGTLDIRWPDREVEVFGFDAVKGEEQSVVREEEEEEKTNVHGEESGEVHEGLEDGYGSTENLINGGLEEGKNEQGEDNRDKKVNGKIAGSKAAHPSLRVGELPMSLQGAYASLIEKSGLSLERYTVYASLKRLGYVVHRAPTWDTDVYQPDGNSAATKSTIPSSTALSRPTINTTAATRLINRITSWLFTTQSRQYSPSHGPLIGPGLYRNYSDIFRTLALVPIHTTTTTTTTTTEAASSILQPNPPTPPFQIHFNVFRPSTPFKKTDPPQSDFRICVLNARTTSIPTLEQITALLDSTPTDTLPKDKKMEQRLKHGMRNVMLAIVDCGLVSYLRMADCGFGDHGKVYEEKARRGGKRGGGFRGRGRGRGRGGRGGGAGAGGGTRGG